MTPARQRATFAVLASAVTAFALMQAMVIPVLPVIQAELGTDSRNIAWIVSLYLLSAAVATPILGRLGDARGKRRVLIALLVLLSVGSLMAAFAQSIELMVVARVIQGLGGGVMPLSMGIARDHFSEQRAGGAVGTLAALGGIGASVGLVLAGPVVDVLGYRALFLLPMGVTIAAGVAAALVIPRSQIEPTRVSWLPAPFLSLALAAFVVATTKVTAWGWLDSRTVGLYLLSIAVGGAWVQLERRARDPLIDLDMLRLAPVRSANLVSFLLGVVMFGVYSYVPQLLQAPASTGYGFGASVLVSGLVMLPMAGCVFAGGLVASALMRKVGAGRVVAGASAVMTAGLAAIAVVHATLWELVPALVVYGAALGVNMAALAILVVLAVPASQSAAAGGVNFNVRNVGGAVGTAVMATCVNATLDESGVPLAHGYVVGFLLLAAAGLIAAALAHTIPRPRLDRVPPSPLPHGTA